MRRVHVEWGATGASVLSKHCSVVVVCDVLSFSTTVSVATARGVVVVPRAWRDANEPGRPALLSPAAMQRVERGSRVVLPSPNGATICVAAAAVGAQVVAGCLRNVSAVAHWCRQQPGDIGVVAAGERWPDDTLRPAYEDWVGAGALVALLRGDADLSPEAEAAAAAAAARRPFAQVTSGLELIGAGFASDVAMAEDVDADGVVPVLESGCFVPR
jgi:2-phosphosulfolactate phosphatase